MPALLVAAGAGIGGVILAWTLYEYIPQWINRVSQTHHVLRRLLLTLNFAFCALVILTFWRVLNFLWTAAMTG